MPLFAEPCSDLKRGSGPRSRGRGDRRHMGPTAADIWRLAPPRRGFPWGKSVPAAEVAAGQYVKLAHFVVHDGPGLACSGEAPDSEQLARLPCL